MSKYTQPHCSAIASAIPWKVLLRILALSADGDSKCKRLAILGSTLVMSITSVGSSLGKPRSHSPVRFFSGWPNSYGWTYCVALPSFERDDNAPTGFSIHSLTPDCSCKSHMRSTNRIAAGCRPSLTFSAQYLEPLKLRCVHGGWAIIKS